MKLRILVKIVEKMLGISIGEDMPRADMYLPERLLAMALVFVAGGIACALFAVFKFSMWAVPCAAGGLGFGVAAFLCWKNQTIRVISDEQFTYTTMFGKTRTYAFSDIQSLRRNQDSLTLFVAGEKVHIESMAILSDRLIAHINKALEERN